MTTTATGLLCWRDFHPQEWQLASLHQILPAPAQMREQRFLVGQQLVEAAVERVLRDQRVVGPEQVGHRAVLEPLPVQSPLAARIDQPVADQGLQHVTPAGAFARVRQPLRPEPIEPELLVELAGEPARAPLARPVQVHRPELHLDAVRLGVLGQRLSGGKQGELAGALLLLVEALDDPAPGGVLAVVDRAEIEQRLLHDPAVGTTPALDDAPVAMRLAILVPPREAQVHGRRFYADPWPWKGAWSSLQPIPECRPLKRLAFCSSKARKSAAAGLSCESWANSLKSLVGVQGLEPWTR